MLKRRGQRAQRVCRARLGLVDVDRLEVGRGGVEHLEVERRLAAGLERVLDPDAERVQSGHVEPEAAREGGDVGRVESVDLDQRDPLALAAHPARVQRAEAVRPLVLSRA